MILASGPPALGLVALVLAVLLLPLVIVGAIRFRWNGFAFAVVNCIVLCFLVVWCGNRAIVRHRGAWFLEMWPFAVYAVLLSLCAFWRREKPPPIHVPWK
jgi:hypothetical protein